MMVTPEELLRERIATMEEKSAMAAIEKQHERAERFARLKRGLERELERLKTIGDRDA